jgi:hypothetical protein
LMHLQIIPNNHPIFRKHNISTFYNLIGFQTMLWYLYNYQVTSIMSLLYQAYFFFHRMPSHMLYIITHTCM